MLPLLAFKDVFLRCEFQTLQRPLPAICGRPPCHMWTAPVPQEFFDGLIGSLASICPACLMRLMTAGKMVFRDASSKHSSDLYRPMGPTDYLASWIDLILPSTPLAAPAQSVRQTRPTDLLSGGNHRCIR